ncbi:zinc knuckle [Ostertagia ostertagi]
MKRIEESVNEGSNESKYRDDLMTDISMTLVSRGIESRDDWRDYIETMERDGEVLADICDILNTDVLQVKKEVEKLQAVVKSKEALDKGGANEMLPVRLEHTDIAHRDVLQETTCSTGRTSVEVLKQHSGNPAREEWVEDRSGTVASQLVTYLRAMACSDPGVFKGSRNENFNEFIRKFKRKYEEVVSCEATLVDILGDDHLAGRAKNIYMALPRSVKEQGFSVVVDEMARLLAQDSTAGRLRALTELRNLRMRPNQDVAEFCVVLERLGQQANPGAAMEERSLEYAQILLDNLAGWPEHFQLVGALHKVEPHRAYNEVKQLALSIEQSKLMLAANRRAAGASWKNRSAHYRENRADREFDHPRDLGRQVSPRSEVHGLEDRGLHDSAHAPHRSNKTMPSQGTSESKKCYSCSRYGHISRDCPQRKARVNQIGHKEQAQVKEKATVSRIIEQARSLGMAVKNARVKRSALIGDRVVVSINLLDRENQALVDTGSMISILPVDILRKAQDSGYDVDALELVEESSLSPVFDASGNRMHFLGAVIVETELHGGNRERVAFHISKGKEEEIILGTNALGRLGIEVSIIGNQEGKIQQRKEEDRGDVTSEGACVCTAS